jgi:DNA end-binding protein Ku
MDMAARSVWTGTLSFGLVSFGVKAYKATDEPNAETSLRQLHRSCNHPINQVTRCLHCNTDVPYSDIAKGFENPDKTFTVLSKDELDSIKPATADVIAIETFVPADSIDPLYIDASYFLAPEKGQAEAYALIHAAMVEKGKVAQSRLTIYGREHIVILRPLGSGFVLQLMRSKNEVRDMSVLPTYVAPGAVVLNPAMLALAGQVVDTYTGTFDVTEYEDAYVKDFKSLVASKQSGTPLAPKTAAPVAPKTDLMAALKASLSANAAKSTKTPVVKATVAPKAKKAKAA